MAESIGVLFTITGVTAEGVAFLRFSNPGTLAAINEYERDNLHVIPSGDNDFAYVYRHGLPPELVGVFVYTYHRDFLARRVIDKLRQIFGEATTLREQS